MVRVDPELKWLDAKCWSRLSKGATPRWKWLRATKLADLPKLHLYNSRLGSLSHGTGGENLRINIDPGPVMMKH